MNVGDQVSRLRAQHGEHFALLDEMLKYQETAENSRVAKYANAALLALLDRDLATRCNVEVGVAVAWITGNVGSVGMRIISSRYFDTPVARQEIELALAQCRWHATEAALSWLRNRGDRFDESLVPEIRSITDEYHAVATQLA